MTEQEFYEVQEAFRFDPCRDTLVPYMVAVLKCKGVVSEDVLMKAAKEGEAFAKTDPSGINVGDIVRIVENTTSGFEAGEVCRVTKITHNAYIDGRTRYHLRHVSGVPSFTMHHPESDFEKVYDYVKSDAPVTPPVKAEKMSKPMKFKKGDYVIVCKKKKGGAPLGSKLKIASADPIDENLPYLAVSDEHGHYWYKADELKLLPESLLS